MPRLSTRVGLLPNLLIALFSLLLALGVAEAVLRGFPSLISVAVLDRFAAPLRHEIADRLGLPTQTTRPRLPSTERSDGGPDMFLYRPGAKSVMRADPVDRDLGAIESMTMDANGFCNPPDKATRAHADIVVLGDSFTWCLEVPPDATATARLEAISGFTTYSLGIPHIGPYEYVELLRRSGLRLKPRLVVMNVYEGNDLRDAVRYLEFRRGRKHLPEEDARSGGLFERSYVLAFLEASVELELKSLHASSAPDFRYRVEAGGRSVPMNVTNRDQDEVETAAQLAAGKVTPAMFEAPLAIFVALAKEAGFEPLVTYVPSAYSAYASSVKFEDLAVGRSVQRLSRAQRDWLAENAARIGYVFLDLTPAFQKAAVSGPLTHFPANVHLTPAGHAVVAQALAVEVGQLLRTPR